MYEIHFSQHPQNLSSCTAYSSVRESVLRPRIVDVCGPISPEPSGQDVEVKAIDHGLSVA